jgi:hypothetical protein
MHAKIIVIILFCISFPCFSATNDEKIFSPNQTSASLLISYAADELNNTPAPEKAEAKKKYLLLYDIYIKARSYMILNKVFFWLSVCSALAVLVWPSVSVVFKSQSDKWVWLKSATIQTTVTAIAALMFTFYSQYKDKQTYAETLMRHVIFSEKTAAELSTKIFEELSKIDKGFSFNDVVNNNAPKKASTSAQPADATPPE